MRSGRYSLASRRISSHFGSMRTDVGGAGGREPRRLGRARPMMLRSAASRCKQIGLGRDEGGLEVVQRDLEPAQPRRR